MISGGAWTRSQDRVARVEEGGCKDIHKHGIYLMLFLACIWWQLVFNEANFKTGTMTTVGFKEAMPLNLSDVMMYIWSFDAYLMINIVYNKLTIYMVICCMSYLLLVIYQGWSPSEIDSLGDENRRNALGDMKNQYRISRSNLCTSCGCWLYWTWSDTPSSPSVPRYK